VRLRHHQDYDVSVFAPVNWGPLWVYVGSSCPRHLIAQSRFRSLIPHNTQHIFKRRQSRSRNFGLVRRMPTNQ